MPVSRWFSRRLRTVLAASVVCALLPITAAGQNQLPDFGDASSATLSPAEEREIGALLMRQIRAQLPVIDDPEVEAYIQSLGYQLVSSGAWGSSDFYFFVIADREVNAFAIPGGYVGINSGLITTTESESELASVVAHEIAHVTQRHIARAIAAAEGTQYATLAGVLAGLLIGIVSSDAGQAAVIGATAAGAQSQINFTRANEKEADRVGIQMLAAAGYDPRAMPTIFEKLDLASRYYTRPPEFLSTHPVTTSRISDSRGRAEQYPYRQVPNTQGYELTRAKLRVLTTHNPRRLLAEFELELKEDRATGRSATLYGRALVLAELGENDRAQQELRKLIAAHPERVRFRVALASQELAAENPKRALATFRDAYGLFPDSKQLVRSYVDALLRNGQGRLALKILDDYSRIYGKGAALYRLEAEAYRQIGKVMDSRMALAEHYYHSGELDAAIHQLQLAANEPGGDFYQNSRLDARLRELESERDYLRSR
jgi:predicted Zn-dependent protease